MTQGPRKAAIHGASEVAGNITDLPANRTKIPERLTLGHFPCNLHVQGGQSSDCLLD